jgi:DNA-binding IclR family transcriptional regulator
MAKQRIKSEAVSSVAVERALAMLEAIGQREAGFSNSELSRRLSIPKSSASYLLRTLERCGYLQRDRSTGRYRLGLKVLSLAGGVRAGFDLKEMALPVMRRLVEETGLTAHLAVLDHGEAVYIEKVEAPGFIKMDTWVGGRMQVNSTSVGKAIAAHLAQAEVDNIIRQHGLKKRTPRTITIHSKFFQELDRVRARGYAVDDEENSLGARCIGAPILDGYGRVLGALGLSGTTGQIDKPSIRRLSETLMEAARETSRQFGFPSSGRLVS